ncbi:hypothetical protein ACFXAZ_19975 [Streptomyces sp. NPDC059477]|uniref:hypothetical protein n=1 Tax=Streptomyces sp. NPDC059477 TaxID=3346847 RepID=UPI00367590A0
MTTSATGSCGGIRVGTIDAKENPIRTRPVDSPTGGELVHAIGSTADVEIDCDPIGIQDFRIPAAIEKASFAPVRPAPGGVREQGTEATRQP